ncbi:hypothetical protein R1sor_003244 [Riccia sorocarpa]|uniref:Uncharacterized protein n=1 Tax=Riccia sorocarpa TaxID=122646 RepID=A0ABD3H432_9MARC
MFYKKILCKDISEESLNRLSDCHYTFEARLVIDATSSNAIVLLFKAAHASGNAVHYTDHGLKNQRKDGTDDFEESPTLALVNTYSGVGHRTEYEVGDNDGDYSFNEEGSEYGEAHTGSLDFTMLRE